MREIIIESMEDLLLEVNSLENCYIYRGQSDVSWFLQTTLERTVGNSFSRDFNTKCEQRSREQFSSRFHLYDKENGAPESLLEWLSIMQHYGVPTRLLDFTASPYAALYFALETYDKTKRPDLALYCINYTQLMDISLSLIKAADNAFRDDRLSILGRQDEVFETTVDRFNREILWVTEPHRLNVRIDRQDGCFLVAGDKGAKIESLIRNPFYEKVDIKKMVIHRSLFESIFALLRKMNISGKSIYGDLMGLSRSIALELKIYSA